MEIVVTESGMQLVAERIVGIKAIEDAAVGNVDVCK